MSHSLILASASPRRAEILTQIGVAFETCPADIDESPQQGESAENLVMRLSVEKARAVQRQHPEAIILASDTLVVSPDNVIFGKPTHAEDCLHMLGQLSNQEHRVLTGVALLSGDRLLTDRSETHVTMVDFDQTWARAYWETGEPRGKAGSYAIQGLGAALIKGIRGSYTGVVGLPVEVVVPLLLSLGIRIWQPVNERDAT